MKLDSPLNSLRIYRVSEQTGDKHQSGFGNPKKHKRKKPASSEQDLPALPDQNARQVTFKDIDNAIKNIQKAHPEWDFELNPRGDEHVVITRERTSGKILRVLEIEELLTIEMVYQTREEGAALPSSILDTRA